MTTYVHFWHIKKCWYARLNSNLKFERSSSDSEDLLVPDSCFLTEGQIRKKLREMYPDCKLVKDRPYHEGARWFGNKRGSRK